MLRAFLNLLRLITLTTLVALTGCAALTGTDPLRVNVVGIEPLPGEGMELRFAVKLRVQNPNNSPLPYDGIALILALRGYDFASGVSDAQGTVPRFGEAVIVVPVTVPATALLKQAYSLAVASGDRTKVSYVARGKVSGTGLGSVRFEASGDITLPSSLGGPPAAAKN